MSGNLVRQDGSWVMFMNCISLGELILASSRKLFHFNIRGFLVAGGVLVFTFQAGAASLVWRPVTNNQWNTTSPNWIGQRATFQTGDSAFFGDNSTGGTTEILIGESMPDIGFTPLDVFPASTTVSNELLSYVFTGGAIGSGSFTKLGNGDVTFQGYFISTPSHNFAGGTFVRGGKLTYYIGSGNAAGYRFGTGPIEIDGGTFILRVRYSDTALHNDCRVTTNGGRLVIARDYDLLPYVGSADLNGEIALGGPLELEGLALDFATDEMTGRIVIDQSVMGARALDFTLPLQLSGPIVDGPGEASNSLLVANRNGFSFVLRITNPSNTYSGGTIVGTTLRQSELLIDPEFTYYAVEVAPESSLGRGPVLVESNAVLRLLGDKNLDANTYLDVQGIVYVSSNVTVQVAELTLGTQVYRNGTFGSANSDGHITGDGIIRVVAGAGTLPTIESISREPGNRVVVRFKAAVFKSYRLETTDSLVTANWAVAATIEADNFPRIVAVTNAIAPDVPARFFRLRSP